MVDYVNVTPAGLRGGGYLLEPRAVFDFSKLDCDLSVHSEVINDRSVNVFRIMNGASSDGYTVVEVMNLISSNLIKNLSFNNNQITYTSVAPSEIQSMSDLNGVITGLRYTDGVILYDTFESSNALLYDSDLTTLAGCITNLRYTDYAIKYDTIGEISE